MTSTWEILTGLGVAVFGSSGATALGIKYLNRRLDGATVEQIKATTEQIATNTAAEQVKIMRDAAQSMRESYEAKFDEMLSDRAISKLEISELRGRVTKLEERERHMLTRAAVHEAWDQLSHGILIKIHPDHPAPPPLLPLSFNPIKDDDHET